MCLFTFIQTNINKGTNAHEDIQLHFMRLSLIEEQYNFIINQQYRTKKSIIILHDVCIWGKYFIDQLKNKIYNMQFVIDNGDNNNFDFQKYNKLISENYKATMIYLIDSYTQISNL